MMNHINFEKLNAVMRLFTIYVEQGTVVADAAYKSEQKLGKDYSNEIRLLRKVFSEKSKAGPDAGIIKPSFFQSLKLDISSSGGDSSKVLSEVSSLMRGTSNGFKACSRFYQSIYTYPIIIIVIAMIVYSTYKLFVYESMVKVFNGPNTLPELSKFAFADSTAIIMLIIIALAAMFFIATIYTLKNQFALFKPSNSWFSRVFFCGNDQCYLLFLLYFKTMLNCDSDSQQSLEKSKLYAGITDSNKLDGYVVKHDVLMAIEVESSEIVSAEVDYQLRSVVDEIEDRLISKQEKILVFFQTLIFLFIGTMVTAMYLPIFKLANVF